MVDIEYLVWPPAIAAVTTGVLYALSYMRHHPEAVELKPEAAVASVRTTLPPGIALTEAVNYALHAGFRLEWVATDVRSVVFGIGPDLRTFGYYFPVRVERTADGGTTFAIGVVRRSGIPLLSFRQRQITAWFSKPIVCGLRVSEFRHTYEPDRPR